MVATQSSPSPLARLSAFGRSLFAKGRPEPSYPTLPAVSSTGQSSVPGVYLTGEVAGTPLIKLGLNQGVEVVEHLHGELGAPADDESLLDLVIVGAGSSGLGAAMRAHELGMRYVVLESERVAMTVQTMFKGKVLFAEPHDVPLKSSMWFEECTREELLERWQAQIEEAGLEVREHEKVTDLKKVGDAFEVTSVRGSYRARRVILAIGKAGNPRKAGVPGENEFAPKVLHSINDASAYADKDIFVYGGGDVACEGVLALSDNNRVTMVTIDPEFIYPKKRNADAVKAKLAAGEIDLHFASQLKAVEDETVVFNDADGKEQRIANDLVLEMIGAELPLPFFKRIGVKLEATWDARRYLGLAAMFVAVYSLYALKKFPETPYAWPFHLFIDPADFSRVSTSIFEVAFAPFRWIFSDAAWSDMRRTTWFQTGYLYSLLYTVVMIVFGVQAFRRWSEKASDNRYQKWRYVSLISFQVGFFLIANVIAVQALSIQHAWRAWGLYQPWPLFFNSFHWFSSSDPKLVIYLFVGAGLFGSFVAIPFFSWRHGKRFCTWVCGCGGLAETLGDRWRHLAPKGAKSRAWEFQGLVIFAAALIVTAITVGAYGTRANNGWALAYSYVVDFWLVAVIPIALYPFYGGKVWCRYWCPLAAWNGVLAKWYGRLRIVSDGQCISCTQCSRYCQVGVDVMAFAKNQAAFDNDDSACIQCGICIDVCPMDVLSFDDSPRGAFRAELEKGVSSAEAARISSGKKLPVVQA
jgi:thioredoxin reductase/ferredoxin